MKRDIITIDEEKCNGCGDCIPNCPEGAIQIIDEKARLISDLMCDGLGACVGHCPEGAITVEQREAEPYDEYKVMANIVRQGAQTVKAHLTHLQEHRQTEYYAQALAYLEEHQVALPMYMEAQPQPGGCPGSRAMAFAKETPKVVVPSGQRPSGLTHWPIQMHLLSPAAPHYRGSDLLLAADCVSYAMGDFHKDYLHGRTLGIGCPKLDMQQDLYLEKLTALIDVAEINSLTVMIMQVPCCRGLLHLAETAAAQANREIPLHCLVVSLQGELLEERQVL